MALMEYEYEINNIGQYSAEGHAMLRRRSEAGWTVNTANLNYNEISILWQRQVPVEGADEQEEDDGLVHVDWRMTPAEFGELSAALRAAADVSPYAAQLEAEGKLGEPEPATVQV